jgi:hypothetical protein
VRGAALVGPVAVALVAASCAGREEPAAAPRAAAAEAMPIAPSAATEPSPAQRPPETREQHLIARELVAVSRARGLSIDRPVPGVVLSRQDIITRIRAHVAREIPPEAIRNEGTANQLLGLIPAGFDYEGAEFGLLEQQIAGYYEPADKTMYLVADLPEEEAVETLAHELVHALQDSRWNLADRSKYRAGESDRALATAALAEGDATSAMFDVSFAAMKSGRTAIDVPDDVFVEKIRENMDHGPGADAPLVMRSSLAAPYLYGLLFVHAMRRRGGWGAVDHAWDAPPVTTEQLLHVDKYDAREPAVAVAEPTFAALGAGWARVDADTYGELGARVDFEDWLDPARAARAASGWGGIARCSCSAATRSRWRGTCATTRGAPRPTSWRSTRFTRSRRRWRRASARRPRTTGARSCASSALIAGRSRSRGAGRTWCSSPGRRARRRARRGTRTATARSRAAGRPRCSRISSRKARSRGACSADLEDRGCSRRARAA